MYRANFLLVAVVIILISCYFGAEKARHNYFLSVVSRAVETRCLNLPFPATDTAFSIQTPRGYTVFDDIRVFRAPFVPRRMNLKTQRTIAYLAGADGRGKAVYMSIEREKSLHPTTATCIN